MCWQSQSYNYRVPFHSPHLMSLCPYLSSCWSKFNSFARWGLPCSSPFLQYLVSKHPCLLKPLMIVLTRTYPNDTGYPAPTETAQELRVRFSCSGDPSHRVLTPASNQPTNISRKYCQYFQMENVMSNCCSYLLSYKSKWDECSWASLNDAHMYVLETVPCGIQDPKFSTLSIMRMNY